MEKHLQDYLALNTKAISDLKVEKCKFRWDKSNWHQNSQRGSFQVYELEGKTLPNRDDCVVEYGKTLPTRMRPFLDVRVV